MSSVRQEPASPVREPAGLGRPTASGAPDHEVFVSYSQRDKPVADAVVARLEQAGIRCWIAPRDVLPGRVWGKAIVDAIGSSRLMVVVLSGDANHSRQVLREVERAVAFDTVVVPFRIECIEPTGAMAYYLASEHWLDAMTPPLEAHIARLVDVAHALLDTASSAEEAAEETAGAEPSQVFVPPPPPAPPRPRSDRQRSRRPLVIAVVLAVLLVVAAGTAALLLLDGLAPAEPTVVGLDEVATGDCLLTPSAYADDPASFWGSEGMQWPLTMATVTCDAPHDAEVLFIGDGWDADMPYPGEASLARRYWAQCDTEFVLYTGVTVPQSELDYTGWLPSEESWRQGDREIACIGFDPSGQPLEGSIRQSGP